MKFTLFAFAFLFAVPPFALAQEEDASPSASPKVPAREKAGDPTVSVTTQKNASPTPRKTETSPSPSKSSSPAAPKTKPSATPSPAPTSSPTDTKQTKKSPVEATIRDIEEKWEASVKNHDSSVPQEYLADDFRGVSSKGKLMSKKELLAELKKDTDTYSSTKAGKVDVRVFGGQFAVATGISTETGKEKDGQEFKRSFRWTDVWVLRNDKWQCVASQAMLVQ
jgi:ketosteroid isomerase-like protein